VQPAVGLVGFADDQDANLASKPHPFCCVYLWGAFCVSSRSDRSEFELGSFEPTPLPPGLIAPCLLWPPWGRQRRHMADGSTGWCRACSLCGRSASCSWGRGGVPGGSDPRSRELVVLIFNLPGASSLVTAALRRPSSSSVGLMAYGRGLTVETFSLGSSYVGIAETVILAARAVSPVAPDDDSLPPPASTSRNALWPGAYIALWSDSSLPRSHRDLLLS